MKSITSLIMFMLAAVCLVLPVSGQEITTVAEINQVDVDGNPVFAGLQTTEKYTIEGVAINDCDVFNGLLNEAGDPETSFILFVQDETGGIQVYSGIWYGGGLSNYPDIKQGDRIRATGLTGHYGGKTNLNERHNPDQKFEITVLEQGVEVEPLEIESLADVYDFDSTRQTGGEYYQGRLVTFKNVQIMEGEWMPGATLTVADVQGNTFPVELRHGTKTGEQNQPQGMLDITGVFDQEDPEAPFTGGYVLWPRSIDDFQPAGGASAVDLWNVYN